MLVKTEVQFPPQNSYLEFRYHLQSKVNLKELILIWCFGHVVNERTRFDSLVWLLVGFSKRSVIDFMIMNIENVDVYRSNLFDYYI